MTWMIWRYSPWLRKPSSSFWVNCMGSGLMWTCHSSCRWSSQNMWIDIFLNVRGFSALGLGASKLQTPGFSHRIDFGGSRSGVHSDVFEKSSRPKIIPQKKTNLGSPSDPKKSQKKNQEILHHLGKSISPSDLPITHLKAPVRHRGQPCKAKVDGEDGADSTHTSAIPGGFFSLR